jgi:hypothetical protein
MSILNLDRDQPGFRSNSKYGNNWYGVLLETHPYFSEYDDSKTKTTSERFDLTKNLGTKSFTGPYTTRDYLTMFGDNSTDYFKNGLHVIDGKTPLRNDSSSITTWDGSETAPGLRLANFKYTPYENNDPVFFGFELIIDGVSSPLLNGSVEDFIEQFSNISEIASKKNVMIDFKLQFEKLFKVKGTPKQVPNTQKTMSVNIPNEANTPSQASYYQLGKKAYLSYYIKKIAGLELLMIGNTSNKKKYLTNYREDLIKLTFSEDVSLTFGTLQHLYKLLYWSKPNGKNLIMENLLRFNCDIVISECRNYQRVRKAMDTGDLETIKDNLSRHIYSLKECQLFFDTPPHDSEIDYESIKDFVGSTITMDYKYVSTKFERWTPDEQRFGQYVGYNDGAIWKVGNPGGRAGSNENSGGVKDVSVPKFFTIGTNTLRSNGVSSPIVFDGWNVSKVNEPLTKEKIAEKQAGIDGGKNETPDPEEGDTGSIDKKSQRKADMKEGLEAFKSASKKAANNLVRSLQNTVDNEIRAQVDIRLRLLNKTLDKVRNSVGISKMRSPTNVYTSHPNHAGMDGESTVPNYISNGAFGGNTGVSPTSFFDVQNAVRDFAGDSLGSILGSKIGNIIKGND